MNFYKSAALALDHLEKHQGSVKGSLSAAGVQGTGGETKRILALVIETLKYRPVIQEILTKVPILTLEKITFPRKTPPKAPSSASLVLVLLHDLLFSSKTKIEASDMWPPKPAVMKHQARLRAELVRIQIKQGKQSKSELARTTDTDGMVRYIRWNPNTDLHRSGDWSLPALIKHLETKGYTQILEPVYPVPVNRWFMDPHLDDCLLVFESGTTWWQGDEWYESGAVILQDKASCFPAKVLMDRWIAGEGECLDATAAPGNKTSYISALMGDQGQLYAFERSQGRFKTLEKMLSRANCENVKAHCGDFLAADPGDRKYSKVTRILLDPSCSGSGIVNRLDYLVEDENAEETDAKAERLEKLAAFQLQMVIHAFRFGSAKRIVYSTCSIHPEEDEQVVMKALASPFAKKNGWVLAPRSAVLPKWERRGRPEETAGKQDLADSVIRCVAGEDKTNGFFVACFVRKGSDVFNEPEPSSETGDKKRPREEDVELAETNEMDVAEDVEREEGVKQSKPPKEKTAAQLARNKRKKQKQKAK